MPSFLSALSGLSASDWIALGALVISAVALIHSIHTAHRQRPLLKLQKRLAELQVAEREDAAEAKAKQREAAKNVRWLIE